MTVAETSKLLTCPQCGADLDPDERTCSGCGIDLILLALLTERAYLEGVPGAAPIQTTPEILVPRIGDYLIQQGVITQEQLEAALDRQKESAATGERRLLGQTLIDLDYIDHETLDRTINIQILELHTALQEANRTLENRVKERTAELQMALERLTEINQIKANLISNISHELRTPLAHIKGYVELIIDEELGALTDPQKDALEVMYRAANRLEHLIEDLIEFSTASREGITLNPQPLSISGLLDSTIRRSQPKSENKDITLELDLTDPLPAVQADPERIEWVLLQLVDNAIKYTPGGGKVVLGARDDGSYLTLVVRDTGVGIPAERIEEIFIPVHQLDGSTTRRQGGTGLGLALVKIILDAHASELKVESMINKGSEFSFTLPVAIDLE